MLGSYGLRARQIGNRAGDSPDANDPPGGNSKGVGGAWTPFTKVPLLCKAENHGCMLCGKLNIGLVSASSRPLKMPALRPRSTRRAGVRHGR